MTALGCTRPLNSEIIALGLPILTHKAGGGRLVLRTNGVSAG
jgi:hypothetical protein